MKTFGWSLVGEVGTQALSWHSVSWNTGGGTREMVYLANAQFSSIWSI